MTWLIYTWCRVKYGQTPLFHQQLGQSQNSEHNETSASMIVRDGDETLTDVWIPI